MGGRENKSHDTGFHSPVCLQMMLRHELSVYFRSAPFHVNIYRIPVKYQNITGVKKSCSYHFCRGEEHKKAPSKSTWVLLLTSENTWDEILDSTAAGGLNLDLHGWNCEKKGSWGWLSKFNCSWRGWLCTTCMVCSFLTCSDNGFAAYLAPQWSHLAC